MEAQEKGGVTIREYMDMQITFVKTELGHIREKIAHEKELGTQAGVALTKALELQAEKYEQRLKDLNHEAQRLSKMVTGEMFDQVTHKIEDDITKIQLWISNQEGKQSRAQWIAIIAVLVSLVALLYNMFK